MAKLKLNNKGFSLIDLIIAVAVMGLLVSPIIAQLGQTLDLSAEAKEKQYVVDSANEVIEYFRKYEDSELVSNVDNEGVLKITNDPKVDKGTETCFLYDNTGTAVYWTPVGSSAAQNFVVYNYTIYKLNDAQDIGKEQNDYERIVIKSDLNNKLYEAGLAVDYSNKSTSSSIISSLPAGFTFRSDNSIVQVDPSNIEAERYDDSKVTGIVVAERPELSVVDAGTGKTFFEKMNLKDSNDIDIGNIQDLDASKMAIIPGDATSLDYQLETDLTAALVQFASANPTTYLGQDADKPAKLNEEIKQLVMNSDATTKSRELRLSVTCGKTPSGADALDPNGKPMYYHVRCDVYYRIRFSGSELTVFNNYTSTVGHFTYNVLDRDYYVTTPPDIYLVYEPLLVTTDATGSATYADTDFISIETDKYTSRINVNPSDRDDATTADGLDPSRLYLIRSTANWQKVTGAETADETNVATVYDPTRYYTKNSSGVYERVQIVINQIMKGADPTLEGRIDVYTNISIKKPSDSLHWQFYVNNNPSAYPYAYTGTGNRTSYDYDNIIKVSDEKGGTADRLGQYTVTYRRKNKTTGTPEGEVTYITGARGAD